VLGATWKGSPVIAIRALAKPFVLKMFQMLRALGFVAEDIAAAKNMCAQDASGSWEKP
jgi:hypothetical protein